MAEGRLLWLDEATGYGLIRPEGGGRSLFVRSRDVSFDEATPVEEGTEVAYDVKQGRTMRATKVVRRPHNSRRDSSSERHEGKEARSEYYEGL